jgi:hydroxymethylpyrimidine/phosphomethylpyrimidine kinase
MLASSAVAEAVAKAVEANDIGPLVVDPVMVAKGGDRLLSPEAVATIRERILPLAHVVTPNLPEAELLAERDIGSLEDMRAAAEILYELGPAAVLVKGGHLGGSEAVDVLFTGNGFTELRAPRVDTRDTHGTGCTLASAIAARLAHGDELERAVDHAKAFVTRAIRDSLRLGRGHGPVNQAAGPLPSRRAARPGQGTRA